MEANQGNREANQGNGDLTQKDRWKGIFLLLIAFTLIVILAELIQSFFPNSGQYLKALIGLFAAGFFWIASDSVAKFSHKKSNLSINISGSILIFFIVYFIGGEEKGGSFTIQLHGYQSQSDITNIPKEGKLVLQVFNGADMNLPLNLTPDGAIPITSDYHGKKVKFSLQISSDDYILQFPDSTYQIQKNIRVYVSVKPNWCKEKDILISEIEQIYQKLQDKIKNTQASIKNLVDKENKEGSLSIEENEKRTELRTTEADLIATKEAITVDLIKFKNIFCDSSLNNQEILSLKKYLQELNNKIIL